MRQILRVVFRRRWWLLLKLWYYHFLRLSRLFLVGSHWIFELDSRATATLYASHSLTHIDLIANGFDVLLANISLMSTGGAVIFLPIKFYKESVFGLTLWAARHTHTHTRLVRLLLFCVSSIRLLMPNQDKVWAELFLFSFIFLSCVSCACHWPFVKYAIDTNRRKREVSAYHRCVVRPILSAEFRKIRSQIQNMNSIKSIENPNILIRIRN